MSNCYLSHKVNTAAADRPHDEGGFMGRTHATSAVAIFLACTAFLPALTQQALGTTNIWIVIMAAIATAGASLVPDLDNTSSTARNSLGPVGHIFSEAVRALSVFVQTFLRTSKDDPDPNPHRGAAHTIPAALLFGGGVYALTKIGKEVSLPVIGDTTWGHVAAILTIFTMLHLALSGLVKPFMKNLGDSTPLGELVSFALSFAVAVALYMQAPHDQGFWWLGVAVFAGCVIHIIGDCFTTAGAPLLFPLSAFLKGKFWWNTRFLSIKAGGAVENVVFVPFFILVIVISALRLVGAF